MSDDLDVPQSVTVQLERAGIPYMVTGSMAVNLYAVPRMSRDEKSNQPINLGQADARLQ